MRRAKRVVCGLLAALLLGLFSACAPGETPPEEKTEFATLADVPGITEEEIAAVEALRDRYDHFVYGMNHTSEAFYEEDGSVGGFTALVCEWLGNLIGIPFEPAIVDWDELMAGLATRDIHFTGELTPTAEREGEFQMTDPIAERSLKTFRLRDSEALAEIAKQRRLRYAFFNGATSLGFVRAVEELPFDVYTVSSHELAAQLLQEGKIDAFFEDGPAEAAFDAYPGIEGRDYFPLIYAPVALMTPSPELEPVIAVVQKCLENGGVEYLAGLYGQGYGQYRQHKLLTRLTPEERDYIKSHSGGQSPIPVALEHDNYPASFYNAREEEYQGIAVDVLAEIGKLTGLEFERANEIGDEWSELLDLLESGDAAVISELIPSKEREGRFLWAQQPYSVDQYALLSRAEHEDITINQVLYAKVGLIYESAYAEVFGEWFPNHPNTVTYHTNEEAFQALEDGEIDFLMATRNLLLSVTNYLEKPGFKANLVFDREYESRYGMNREQELLCSIITKAQDVVDTGAITDRWTRKVFDYRAKLAGSQIPYLIGASILLVVILVLVVIMLIRNRGMSRQLEATVHERTRELEIQTEAAQVASRAKSEFLARMSHENRTPLNAVMGMAQVARQDVAGLEGSEKAASSIGEILTASRHLMGILNDVLDMSKIESGKFEMACEPFDLVAGLAEVENIMGQRCREKGITFATSIHELPELWVMGDKLRLKQVLINLLGNAVKFTGRGGTISFLADLEEAGEETARVRFSVRDDGIGMSGAQVDKLFVAFEQADSSIASRFGGTGLGLAISQNLVGMMGGEITVESAVGAGSLFTFTLALPRTQPQCLLTAPHPVAQDALDFSNRRLLLAEDIDINRLILMELLDDTGLQMEEATDGEEAVGLFAASPPGHFDMVLMDIQMPGMDGYEATRAIRAMDRPDANLPIIAMTANAYQEDVSRALAAGMNGHLAKPIDIDQVKSTLATWLNGGAANGPGEGL